ncbi:MAG: antibiotic biosynthesis monooxygenase [Hyphomicrobiales bacterium]|nr:antibiotic biosynthesis monooxygenase [Hyphomicrobiales bacterium]
MYIVMNKFKIVTGSEKKFEEVWKKRDSNLDDVQGFIKFYLIKGERNDEYSIYASHSTWNSQQDFYNWVKSDAFRQAHKGAGKHADLYLGPPQLEEYEVIL